MAKTDDIKRVPKLRFSEFEGEWKRKKLQDYELNVIDGDRGINYPNGDDFSPNGYCLFLNAKNVTQKGFSFDQTIFINKEKDSVLRKGKLKRNDLILTTRGTVGNIAYYDESVIYSHLRINSGMVIIRNEDRKVCPGFVYISFFTCPLVKQIRTTVFGSAQPQLTVKGIYKFQLTMPTLPEQEKIASFLTAVDKKIQQLTAKKELLEQYKKGVMQKIFSQEIRFTDDNGKDYPDWQEKKLGELGCINPRTPELPDKFIYIDLESVAKGRLLKEEIVFSRDAPSRAQRVMRKGDILFQMVRPYQKNNLFFDFDGDYVASTGYAQIRAKEDSIFLYQLLHNQPLVNLIIRSSTGSNYPAINSTDLNAISAKVPSIFEQKKIGAFLQNIDNKIESVQSQLTQTQTFKKGLLQQLFV